MKNENGYRFWSQLSGGEFVVFSKAFKDRVIISQLAAANAAFSRSMKRRLQLRL